MTDLQAGFKFLQVTPNYDMAYMREAPWPIFFYPKGIVSSFTGDACEIAAVPEYATESITDETFFSLVPSGNAALCRDTRQAISEIPLSLRRNIVNMAIPYGDIYGKLYKHERIMDLRVLELNLAYSIFDRLDENVRQLFARPEATDQAVWRVIVIGKYSPTRVVEDYLFKHYPGYKFSPGIVDSTTIATGFRPERTVKFQTNVISGPTLDDFTQMSQLISIVTKHTHNLGAHLLFLVPEMLMFLECPEIFSDLIQYSKLPLFITCVLLAITPGVVAFEGTCVFQTTDMWTPIHGELLQLCSVFFDEVVIVKSVTIRLLAVEQWVVLHKRNRRRSTIDLDSFVKVIKEIIAVQFPVQSQQPDAPCYSTVPFQFVSSIIRPTLLKMFGAEETDTLKYLRAINGELTTVQNAAYLQALLVHATLEPPHDTTLLFRILRKYQNTLVFSGIPTTIEAELPEQGADNIRDAIARLNRCVGKTYSEIDLADLDLVLREAFLSCRGILFPDNCYRDVMLGVYREAVMGIPYEQSILRIIGADGNTRDATVQWTEKNAQYERVLEVKVHQRQRAQQETDNGIVGLAVAREGPTEEPQRKKEPRKRNVLNDLLKRRASR